MNQQSPDTVSFPARAALLLVSWVSACVMVVIGHGFGPGILVAIPWFPMGLFQILHWNLNPIAFLAFGWAPYVILTLAVLGVRSRALYFLFQLCLVVLLIVTAAGCRSILNDPRAFSL